MDFMIVERKSVKGKPTWYFYGPTGYLGALFFPDTDHTDALNELFAMGHDTNDVELTFRDGPGFHQSAKAS